MSLEIKTRVRMFVQEHRIICYVVGGTIVVGLSYIGLKHMLSAKPTTAATVVETGVELATMPVKTELPFKHLWENLSGEALTPTKLGDETFSTARTINRRLVEHGLQTRNQYGEYIQTDLGLKFGKNTWKVTRAGHSFSNIEWDKRVLEIIFTADELQEIAERKQYFANHYSA